jgi:plastocyanin
MKKIVSISVLFVGLGFGLAGLCAETGTVMPSTQQKTGATEVKIDNFSFGPAELTVPVGTTVPWTNRDDIPHTVVNTDKVFSRKCWIPRKFSFTFDTGTFPTSAPSTRR